MLLNYEDVTSRIDEPPKWYTKYGYPRYCEFSPGETGVYVHYALLVEIQCQSCHRPFLVGEGYQRENIYAILDGDEENFFYDLNKIVEGYHYGDPPPHDCVGDTMNCDDIRFVEVWDREKGIEKHTRENGEEFLFKTWGRVTELEKPC